MAACVQRHGKIIESNLLRSVMVSKLQDTNFIRQIAFIQRHKVAKYHSISLGSSYHKYSSKTTSTPSTCITTSNLTKITCSYRCHSYTTTGSNSTSTRSASTLEPEIDISGSQLRTNVADPRLHSKSDLLKYYTLSDAAVKSFSLNKLLRGEYVARTKAFSETSLMIRSPALEARDLLFKYAKPDSLAPKILLHGSDGCGKSSIFLHVMHACQSAGWLIICPLRQYLWNDFFKEVSASTHKNGRIDLPEEGAEFLMSLKQMNSDIFINYGNQLRTNYEYKWSHREFTPKGSTLEELLTFGLDRPKFSSDVVGAFLKEFRLHSREWPCISLLAIDGVNSLYEKTRIFTHRQKRETLPPNRISLIHHLRKLLSSGWSNSGALLTVDTKSAEIQFRRDSMPRHLLKEEGFDEINPFIPIEVKNYSEREINAALDYLIDRQWIQNEAYRQSPDVRKELIFLSARNPLYLDKVTRCV